MVEGGGGSVMSSSAKRRGFDRGYKEEAVRLVVEEKRSVAWCPTRQGGIPLDTNTVIGILPA
jgi:hypothetical protein